MRIRSVIHNPTLVFALCGLFLVISLMSRGTLWRLWSLHREQDRLQKDILDLHQQTRDLELQILKVKDPTYIERQARDRLDLVGQNDLVFVFPSGQ